MSAPLMQSGDAGGSAAAAASPEARILPMEQQQQAGAAAAAAGGGGAAAPPASSGTSSDALYCFNQAVLDTLRRDKPWTKDPKYFKKVKISPSAAMKMLMHANSGVDKGIKKGGKPVEVMGMLLGRPDMEPHSLVVTDVFPLPIEGAETRVLADDQEVTNYMIELGESLEATRRERFMGWYHSHPFEVEAHSHCFLSSTDLSTQLSWQRAEDPHGNPWLAIVVDPLRSLAKGRPEFGAFRAYPPDYSAPPNETPDGKVVTDDTQRVERWGSCWDRYCTLEVEYFMSSLASRVMGTLTESFLWMRALSTTPLLEKESQEHTCERMCGVADRLKQARTTFTFRGGASLMVDVHSSGARGSRDPAADSLLSKATDTATDLALEHCQEQAAQAIKAAVFAPVGGGEGVAPAVVAQQQAEAGGQAPVPMEVAGQA